MAVVGAGVSGLVAAHSLRRRRVKVVVFEAGGRLGGFLTAGGRILHRFPQQEREELRL
ncbi:MAG: FAD-dependent oxidoreductase [Pyrodictiaceae archaeon]